MPQVIVETPEKNKHFKWKLGRPYIITDTRTFKLAKLISKVLPPITYPFDVDSQYPFMVDNNMYGNDRLGDCVIAGRAHATLRLEANQQGSLIKITDQDVENEYFKETGGSDSGLDILTSLNEWRQTGWSAAGKTYKIYAYAAIEMTNHAEVEDALFLFNGVYAGVNLPITAQSQTGVNSVWDIVPNGGASADPGSWGGHCVEIVALNLTGPVCITWGARQQMTWAFWDKYFDQAFAVIDNIDSWVDPATNPVNVQLLSQYLNEVTTAPVNPTPPTPASGSIIFQVTPSNSTIYIDGSALPGQPTSILVNPGTYKISAKLKGYKTASTSVTVAANSNVIVSLNLKKNNCWLANLS